MPGVKGTATGDAVIIVPGGDMESLSKVNVYPLEDDISTIHFALVTRKIESRNRLIEEVLACILPKMT